jgi:hypothetical protein
MYPRSINTIAEQLMFHRFNNLKHKRIVVV